MQAVVIAKRAAEEIVSGRFGLAVMKFPNPDMVGHTGNMKATIKAVETFDVALGIVIDALTQSAASP